MYEYVTVTDSTPQSKSEEGSGDGIKTPTTVKSRTQTNVSNSQF